MTAPKLRFKEFDRDWTLKNLGDSFSLISGYAFPSSASTDSGAKWLKIADVGIQEMTPNNPSYLPLEYLEKYSQFIVNKDDYVIALTRPILNKKLKIAKVGDFYDGALLNQRVAKIASTDNDLDFIYSLLQKSKTVEELDNSIAGTDPPNLSLNDVKEIKLSFPSKEEQTKIASFLSAVDEKMNQLTQKHSLLSQYKQGMMQKLFSQQIRFKADDGSEFGEWVDWKFASCIDIFDNLRKPVSASERKVGFTPYYGANGIQSYIDGYTHEGEFILIAEDGANDLINYPVQYVNGKIWVNNHAHVVSGKQHIVDNKFLKYRLGSIDFTKYLVGGGRAKLNAGAMKEIAFLLPCLEEQTKIANFLSAIDQKIEVVAQQIEHAKQWKKGVLQQMFV